MNPDQTLDPRFNLNNYRLPSQRRQSSSSAISPQAQQQMASIASPTTSSRPVVPAAAPTSPIINNARNAPAAPLRRVAESWQGIDQNLITLQQVFSTIPAFAPVTPISGTSASTSSNPTTGTISDSFFADSSAFDDWFRTVVLPGSAPPPVATQAPPVFPPPAPATSESVRRATISATAMPTSSAGPSNTIILKILEKMDSLAARQDSIFNFIKHALQTRAAESAELKAKNDQIDIQRAGLAENIMTTTTKAISVLTERIDGLVSDVTAVRNALGVPPHISGPEITDAAKYIRQERMKPADVQDSNTATGGSPNHAINVDEIDEPPVSGAEQSTSRAQRSILDRLDSIEVDFAEFMERVRDPEADVDQLRGRSSLNTSGSRIRSMQDMGTSPRTPSPAPIAMDAIAQTTPEQNDELRQAMPVFGHENWAQNMDDAIPPAKDSSPSLSSPDRAPDVRDTPSGLQLIPGNISPIMLDDNAVSPPQEYMEEVDELFDSYRESSNSQSHLDSSSKGKGKRCHSSVKVASSVVETDSGSESAILVTKAKPIQSYSLHQRKPVFFEYHLSTSGNEQDNALLRRDRQKTLSRLYGSGDGAHIQHTIQGSTPARKGKSKSKTPETSGPEETKMSVWASELIPSASSDYPQLKVGPPRKRKSAKSPSASASKSSSTASKERRIQSNTSPSSLGSDNPRSTKRLKRYVSSEDEDSVIYVQPRKRAPK